MTFTLPALLSLFSLLAISTGVFFLAKRAKLPYTVLLVAVGTFVLVPLAQLPAFSFIAAFSLTPELLFYLFLPILIFESAYNINIRRLAESSITISLLAVVSLLVSAAFVSGALYLLLPFVGLDVPFIVCLLFGALISATDPVAVLALFKDVGAPRRLTLIFEGESIFNDGTAVALFLVVLEMAVHGFHGASSIVEGMVTFLMMVIGGSIFGLVLGGLFTKAIGGARSNEFVQITLMLVLAHLTFILTDFLSQNLTLFGHSIHLSAIIATTFASMVVGNYGRAKILPHTHEFVEKFWTQFAFFSNSLVFILIGLIFTQLPIALADFLVPIGLGIVVVALGRAASIYPVTSLVNALGIEEHVPISWQHLLAWGSLRGALAITMVLLIPDSLSIPGWELAYTPKEFILALTIGCIFMTLFLKATTIERIMKHLKVSNLTETEKLAYEEARGIVHHKALARLEHFEERGYVSDALYARLTAAHRARLQTSEERCGSTLARSARSGERVLAMYLIGVELEMLNRLYTFGEVTESVYRTVHDKLTRRYEVYDFGDTPGARTAQTPDLFEVLARVVRRVVLRREGAPTPEDRYMYYRTHNILARAALHELRACKAERDESLFGDEAITGAFERYESFRTGSAAKMDATEASAPEAIEREAERLTRHSLLEVEERALDELYERKMLTPKIYIALTDELEAEAERLEDLDEHRDDRIAQTA